MAGSEGASGSQPSDAKPLCLVIYPMGSDNSGEQDDAAQRFKLILNALAGSYTVQRAGNLPNPGDIPRQALEAIVDADLIVADVTNSNPSVLYELAICHLLARIVIQVIAQPDSHESHQGMKPDELPVYARNQRTVKVDVADPGPAKKELQELATSAQALRADQRTPMTSELRMKIADRLLEDLGHIWPITGGARAAWPSSEPRPAGIKQDAGNTGHPDVHELPSSSEGVFAPTRGRFARSNALFGEAVNTLNRAAALRAAADAVDDDALQAQLLEDALALEQIAASAVRSTRVGLERRQ